VSQNRDDSLSIVSIPQYNTILTDAIRKHFAPSIDLMFAIVPEMMSRKIAEANIQQAFILSAVLSVAKFPNANVLCIGSFEDTACETLLAMGYRVEGLDPNVDGRDLSDFIATNQDKLGTYDVVFSTSVIEHVPDDEAFARDINSLLRPSGYAVLTCDFCESWKPGDRLPPTDERFYRSSDLRKRLLGCMSGCAFVDEPDWEQHQPDFHYGGCDYSFASFVVQKSPLTELTSNAPKSANSDDKAAPILGTVCNDVHGHGIEGLLGRIQTEFQECNLRVAFASTDKPEVATIKIRQLTNQLTKAIQKSSIQLEIVSINNNKNDLMSFFQANELNLFFQTNVAFKQMYRWASAAIQSQSPLAFRETNCCDTVFQSPAPESAVEEQTLQVLRSKPQQGITLRPKIMAWLRAKLRRFI